MDACCRLKKTAGSTESEPRSAPGRRCCRQLLAKRQGFQSLLPCRGEKAIKQPSVKAIKDGPAFPRNASLIYCFSKSFIFFVIVDSHDLDPKESTPHKPPKRIGVPPQQGQQKGGHQCQRDTPAQTSAPISPSFGGHVGSGTGGQCHQGPIMHRRFRRGQKHDQGSRTSCKSASAGSQCPSR